MLVEDGDDLLVEDRAEQIVVVDITKFVDAKDLLLIKDQEEQIAVVIDDVVTMLKLVSENKLDISPKNKLYMLVELVVTTIFGISVLILVPENSVLRVAVSAKVGPVCV